MEAQPIGPLTAVALVPLLACVSTAARGVSGSAAASEEGYEALITAANAQRLTESGRLDLVASSLVLEPIRPNVTDPIEVAIRVAAAGKRCPAGEVVFRRWPGGTTITRVYGSLDVRTPNAHADAGEQMIRAVFDPPQPTIGGTLRIDVTLLPPPGEAPLGVHEVSREFAVSAVPASTTSERMASSSGALDTAANEAAPVVDEKIEEQKILKLERLLDQIEIQTNRASEAQHAATAEVVALAAASTPTRRRAAIASAAVFARSARASADSVRDLLKVATELAAGIHGQLPADTYARLAELRSFAMSVADAAAAEAERAAEEAHQRERRSQSKE